MTPRTPSILVINGPNLNLLGTREPDVYGTATLDDVVRLASDTARERGCAVRAVQSNHEGGIIDAIHAARTTTDGIVINAGAYTHTSIAIRDALAGVGLPVVEVHISNVHRREPFRHTSYISGVADAVIVGAGIDGYRLAVDHLAGRLTAAAPDAARAPEN
ncbi:type II 3-dehydroquinate dehydratase [Arthrobacter pityocampae]|uniref:3-dehydroquinate dehydratase n=1 Tax=Arthrobacter pityocampae TaxID=547334 RepID=A0A2S5IX18_9MICC|nr:type II 3-dehydroquinate dehydratase [Arthrobacter pityocampae]PPB49132.1 type II 3-dehydroquinate dehydratase [Arthrobacter pityocampae]